MDDFTYGYMASILNKVPPMQQTPEGQKFHIGEIVRITNPSSWFARKREGKLFRVEYTYFQKYGSMQEIETKSYSLEHLFEKNSSAWYEESELELVKGIDEINEEKDLAEYERLKTKYAKEQDA